MFNDLFDPKWNLEFPPGAKCPKEKKDSKTAAKNNKKMSVPEPSSEGPFVYKENNIGVAMSVISQMILPEESNKRINKQEQGLLVTTTSMPDMMVLNPILSEKDKPKLYELIHGEFKHANQYSMKNAELQCFAYLYAALYWFRVVQGFPLKTVYGFGVCGHKCSGLKNGTYKVGFFRLSAPS